MSPATLIGFLAGTLTTLAFVPQVRKTFRTKRCDDISGGMLISLSSGVCLWVVYGICVHSAPVIVANLVTLALLASILVMKIVYRRGVAE